jgi:hypothetical protein
MALLCVEQVSGVSEPGCGQQTPSPADLLSRMRVKFYESRSDNDSSLAFSTTSTINAIYQQVSLRRLEHERSMALDHRTTVARPI